MLVRATARTCAHLHGREKLETPPRLELADSRRHGLYGYGLYNHGRVCEVYYNLKRAGISGSLPEQLWPGFIIMAESRHRGWSRPTYEGMHEPHIQLHAHMHVILGLLYSLFTFCLEPCRETNVQVALDGACYST